MIASRTAPRSCSRTIWLRLTKRIGAVHLGVVEERELLLVAQHLDGRLAQHGEVERRPLRGGVGEHDLVRQRGLAASGGAGDDVEGVLGQAAAEDFVEARHAGGQLPDDHSILS